MSSRVLSAGVVIAGIVLTTDRAAAAPPPYQLVGSFTGPGSTFDVAPDGRVYALVGRTIVRQETINGSVFAPVAELPAGSINSFGASFLRFSPDGQRLAIGDGNFSSSAAVLIVDAAPLNAAPPAPQPATILTTATSPNFDAAWDAAGRLYVTGARSSDFVSVVNRIDFSGSTPAVNTVITGVGSASGGIALNAGRLYTGSGFLPTGEVRWFELASLGAGPAMAFSAGSLLGSYLSASPLDFDGFGNLLAGGGDIFSGTSDTGYAAVVDLADPLNPLHLSPVGAAATYSPIFNHVTGEVLIFDSLTSTFHRYAIPTPGTLATLTLGGLLAARRRRR